MASYLYIKGNRAYVTLSWLICMVWLPYCSPRAARTDFALGLRG